MSTSELFAAEWQGLNEKRLKLVNQADELKRKLSSLTSEPAMNQLLEEKASLKKKIPDLRSDVEMHHSATRRKCWWIKQRRLAKTDKKIRRDLYKRLRERKVRLARLQELKAPETIIENEQRIVFEVEGPIEEVEQLYQRMNAESAKKEQQAQQVLDETLNRIATIEEYYRQTRHCLEQAIRDAEQRKLQCRTEEIEWATQDRPHLEWMIESEPSYKDDVARRYKIRFPSDNLNDLFPPAPVSSPIFQRPNGKKRHSQPAAPSSPVAEPVSSAPQAWRFRVTFNAGDPGQELSREKGQFLSGLQSALDKAGYRGLDVKIAYDKLFSVGKMTMQQRQEMNKVVEAEPQGWKILRVGKKHRLFLSIDEERRQIRFLPCQRKKSYQHH